jgi:ABC-type transporter Mla maintaining outer membrane lipid asymmetry ATPase subunit MlaF
MSETQTIAVEFKHVMKSFGTKRVLNDVSFHIDQGQALCLLGRSGTGKSVTLKLIMALIQPDSGELWVDQDNVVGMGEKRVSLVRKKLGYLFQDAALFDSLTLYENLALPLARLTKKSKDEIDDVVHRVLTDVGLGTDGAKFPSAQWLANLLRSEAMSRRYLAVGIFIIASLTLFAIGIFLVGSRHEAFSRHVLLYTDLVADRTNQLQ